MICLVLIAALLTAPTTCQYYENWAYTYNQQPNGQYQGHQVYSVQQPNQQPQVFAQSFQPQQFQQPQFQQYQQQQQQQFQQGPRYFEGQQFQQPAQQYQQQAAPAPAQQYQQQVPVQQYQQQAAPAPVQQQQQQQAAPAAAAQFHAQPAAYQEPFVHNNNVRSISNYQENRVFREQQVSHTQGQEKVVLLAKPPPPPTAAARPIQYRAPEPPKQFVPSLRDLAAASFSSASSVQPNSYKPTEVTVDGHRSALENIERVAPQNKARNGPQYHRSSSANAPPPNQRQKSPEPQANAVIANIPQVQLVEKPAPITRPVQRPTPAQRPAPVQKPRGGLRSGVPQATVVVPQQKRPAAVPAQPRGGAAKSASDKFLNCCQNRKVDKSCERICNFDVLSKKTLTGMFLGTDPCPQSHGIDLMQCAANNEDHTQCCIEKEVDRTKAGNKCLGFCNMKPGVTFQADVSMLPCWGVLNDIKDCFKENLERHFLI